MKLLHLATTPSTMAEARALLEQGDTATHAVLADSQTGGRGRLGRTWQTFPAPHSLACTYIIREECAHLPLLVSLAVFETLHMPGLAIKWPNDVLLHGQKVAGILCEGLAPGVFLAGVGVNIRPPEAVPEGFTGAFLGVETPPRKLAEAIGACLLNHLALYRSQGWAAFQNNYAHACRTFGQQITWRGADGTTELTGLARGLNQQGHLELVADDGTVHIIHSGEIVAQSGLHLPPPRN